MRYYTYSNTMRQKKASFLKFYFYSTDIVGSCRFKRKEERVRLLQRAVEVRRLGNRQKMDKIDTGTKK